MDEEFLYKKIQAALENIPGNFNVLEEQIDVQLQMEYFEFAGKFRKEEDVDAMIEQKELLFDAAQPAALKKKILVSLATSVEVDSFRTIERYFKNPDEGLRDWTVLALQESRMLLQSSLLDEQQVFISTGLGGKGKKLRYFVVFMHNDGMELTPMQKKLLHDELQYMVDKNEGELEEFNEMLDYTTAVVILPLKAALKDIFRGVIDECNQYGNFLKEDMVITNVKRLKPVEIVDILNQQKALDVAGGPENPEDPDDNG